MAGISLPDPFNVLPVCRDNFTTLVVTVLHADSTPVDLTGCEILQCFKLKTTDSNAVAAITKGNYGPYTGITISDASDGIFQSQLVPGDTASFDNDDILFTDVLITDQSGNPFSVGTVTIIQILGNITRY